jgi:ferredoxin
MRIKADRDVCIGSGQCVLTEPAIFDQDDEGLVELLVESPTGEAEKAARTAVHICPSGALSVDE